MTKSSRGIGYHEGMKNQYYGDINDYRKYGLLRALFRETPITVCWMLTPDDRGPDGKKIQYLERAKKWRQFDPDLFDHLHDHVAVQERRGVEDFERSDLLPHARYYSAITPDDGDARRSYFEDLFQISEGTELIFFDPDDCMEVKSRPYGRKDSSKYLYWHEVEQTWDRGYSLLIFQHFTREKRSTLMDRHTSEFRTRLDAKLFQLIVTSHVVFYLVLQPQHATLLADKTALDSWSKESHLACQ